MPPSKFDKMREGIQKLGVATPQIRDTYWGGAEVVITPERITESPGAFYPPHRQFVTQFASEATWIFESLRDLLSPVIDAGNKYDFYERLAAAGERHSDWSTMRNAILDAATRWLDEIAADSNRV